MTTVHTHVAEMHFPAIRTAVRAHSGNRWVGFLEGIDAQKLSWSTRCKTILISKTPLSESRSKFIEVVAMSAHFISSDPWSFWPW